MVMEVRKAINFGLGGGQGNDGVMEMSYSLIWVMATEVLSYVNTQLGCNVIYK